MHKTATTTNISFCELEPRIRLDYAHVESDKRICNHFDAVNYVCEEIMDLPQESTYAIFLDGRLTPLGYTCVGQGTHSVCTVSVAKIVQVSVLAAAAGVILVHNHPDMKQPCASSLDVECAHRIAAILKEVDGMILYDSVIVSCDTSTKLYSMREDGKLEDLPSYQDLIRASNRT